jgi:ankyrin repeat protein
MVSALLRKGADPNGVTDCNGLAPLALAAGRGHTEIVQVRMRMRRMMMMVCVWGGDDGDDDGGGDIGGADPNGVTDCNGLAPLALAAIVQVMMNVMMMITMMVVVVVVMMMMMTRTRTRTMTTMTMMMMTPSYPQALLARGANANATTPSKQSALMTAALHDDGGTS